MVAIVKQHRSNRRPPSLTPHFDRDETNPPHVTRRELETALREGARWEENPSHIHNPPTDAVNNLTSEHAWPFAAPLLFLVVLMTGLVASCWFATRPSIHPVPGSEITYAKDGGP